MKYFFTFIILIFGTSVFAKGKAFDEYKTKVEVPEPLFIDLVRSLSAEVGEWEINSLFYHSQGTYDDLNWAPEIELVLYDGTAIEFEFPIEGFDLAHYKFAFQQRVYESKRSKSLHGVQLIYESNKKFDLSESTFYYILAHRFNHHWSAIGLWGFKSLIEGFEGLELQINQSLFYNYSREIDLGLEFNYASGELEGRYFQVVPQLHLAFNHGYKIQFGFGAIDDGSTLSPVGTFRFIKEFNE